MGIFHTHQKQDLMIFKIALSNYVKDLKNENIPSKNVLPVDSAARAMYIVAKAFLNLERNDCF